MKIASRFYMGAVSVVAIVAALLVLNMVGTDSQAMSSYRNCDADAILKCGALSEAELLRKYDQNVGDIRNIYRHYGISRTDIAGTTSDVRTGTVYQDGRVVVDGETVATGAYSLSRVKFTSAGTPRTATINGTRFYEGPSMRIFTRPVDAFVLFRDGKFYKAILSSCGNPIIATPEKPEPKPEPVYRCDNLTANKLDRTRYRFTASATARDGAEIVSHTFTFGDGKSETSSDNTIEHTYAEAGSYRAYVTVNIKVNGKIVHETSKHCKTTIEIEEKPEKPVYRCDNLTAKLVGSRERTFAYTLTYTAEGGATLDRVTYDFGDDTSETFDASDAINVEHTYGAPGTFTTTATLYFTIDKDGETVEESDTCEVKVTIPKPDDCPLPGKEHLPKDSPECKETPCPIPGKEHLPKDSPECEETPPELPKTGFDMFVGGSLGVGSITAAGYYWVASRKNLLSALLDR